MTYNFEIAIPSFNRADIIANRTIKLLKEMKVPKRKIRIFLRDMEQLEEYKKTIGNYKYELTGQWNISYKELFENLLPRKEWITWSIIYGRRHRTIQYIR